MPSKEVYWANPEKYRAATKKWGDENPDKKREAAREWVAEKRKRAPGFEKSAQKKYRDQNKEVCAQRTRDWQLRHPGYHMLKNAYQRAKKRGLPFNITLEDIVVPEVCPVLGIALTVYRGQRSGGFKDDSPSLDRIVPSKGYVRGNIRVISYRANTIKRDATAAELRAIADYIERETQPLSVTVLG